MTVYTLVFTVATLDTCGRPVVRAHALSYQIVLIRRRNQLLIKIARVNVILVAQFELLVVWDVVLLPHVYHRRSHIRKLTFLVSSSFHTSGNISLMLNELQILQLVILSVKILSCVIEDLHLI